jgi:hypothetical protein
MKKSKFPYLLGFSAFATAAIAAYFSVTGLGKLFAGSAISIMVMAAVLEFSKLVVASYVYRYWKKIKALEKTYLISALVVLMAITSAGIYGYLSGAYAETSSKLQISQGEISLLDKKTEQFKERIKNTEENIKKKNERITSLNNLRTSQEVRLDSLYARRYYKQAKIVEGQIKDADVEIKKLTRESDSLLNVVNGYNEEISKLELDVNGKEAENLKGEAAPLQYIANLFNTSMDSVVNFFMFLLIFVFDPLAVVLVIATNKVILDSWKEGSPEEGEPIGELFKVKKPKSNWTVKKLFNGKSEEIKEEESGSEENDVMTYVSTDSGEFKAEEEPRSAIEEQTQSEQVDDFANIQPTQIEELTSPTEEDMEAIKKINDLSIQSQNDKYPLLLDVLYSNGLKTPGDDVPFYQDFCESIRKSGIQAEDSEIKNFLVICVVFKLINIQKNTKHSFLKDYNTAKNKIQILQKN